MQNKLPEGNCPRPLGREQTRGGWPLSRQCTVASSAADGSHGQQFNFTIFSLTLLPVQAHRFSQHHFLPSNPKFGRWLNMPEIELNVLTGQCLNRRIDDIEVVRKEVNAWQKHRNNRQAKGNWQFSTKDARAKLPHVSDVRKLTRHQLGQYN